ncbi:MAG: C10 family peptidase [Bacteroidales bacterium]|nr:C10 family peptidase [Bacteroidales bacterium]
MKKALLFLAMALLTLTAAAKPVDPATAMRVASNFMRIQGVTSQLTDVTAQTPYTQFYIFTAKSGGFVLVSGDDCVVPILGYSTTSVFYTEHIPTNVAGMLEQYDDEISYWKQQEGLSTNADWTPIIHGAMPEPINPTAVSPLCSTSWGQDPLYNNLCPYDASLSERSVTGCVATATAQIMKKWNYPTTGYGSHSYVEDDFGTLSANFGTTTYQWNNMPNALTSTSSTAQINAVATLMYHIGVADEMDYAVASSGANNYNYFGYVDDATSESSLQYYFKYRSDMAAIARVDYSNTAYINLLKADLDAGRPILFSGRDTDGGHSFVLDGYNNSNQFHVNWGWNGAYNGHFAIGSLNPDGGGTGANAGTYNLQNVALIKIQPNTNWSSTGSTTVTANATGGTGCSVSGAGTYSFGDTIHLQAIAATGYHFTGWSDGSKFNPRECIANGGSLSFTAQFEALGGDTITYCPGNRYLTSLGNTSGTSYWGIRIPAASVAGDTLTKVQLYVTETGSYTLTVYSGTSSPTTTLKNASVNITSTGWTTLNITNGVACPAGQDIWITFSHSGGYPAAMSYSGGHNYGLLWGSSFGYAGYTQCSWMIRGIFGNGGSTPTPPPADSCNITSFPYTEGFENSSTLGCWRVIDGNSDSNSWRLIQSIGSGSTAVTPHAGSYMIGSFSWNNVAYNVNEYLVMPPVTVPATGVTSISWWFRVNGTYPEDKLALKVATVANPSSSDFTTTLIDITPTSANGSWTNQIVDLSTYAGQTITLAFHHHDSYDYNYIVLDDISITNTSAPVQYTITVQSANPTMGTVSGGGTFTAGATTTISATANSGYHFTQWNDGNSNASRTITVTGNATYIASFAANATPGSSDTISWCDTASYSSTIGAGGTLYWGISLTPTQLSGHNYLKSVMLYVANAGTYTLRLHTGGTTAPGTLAHTQTATFTESQLGWQEILLDATFPINATQNLWITFYNSGVAYPAAGCAYVGNTNSDWASVDDAAWDHLQNLSASLTYSWLIKAVTSQNAGPLPAPTVSIAGPTFTATGVAQTFTATASTGATVTWMLNGASPASATGLTATATWSTPGTYNVIATATNASGSTSDTLTINVISCGTISTYPYTLTFEPNDINQLACWTTLDIDGDGYSWTTTPVANLTGSIGSASYINEVGALTPDNWLISPQMQFATGSTYTLSWKTWALDASYYAEHYGVYVSTTGTATSNFNLVQQYTMASADTTTMTLDLSSYAGQTIYIAFRHWNVTDEYWMMLDDISITQTAIPGQNYTITVQSANPTMGTVSGGGTFTAGATTTISATANSGYHFTQWNDGNTNASRTITVTGNATYIANFESDAPNQYTITVQSANPTMGTVSGGGIYNEGAAITISATAFSGYHFTQWNDGNTNATRTITVTGNATYIANFEANPPQQYTITVMSANEQMGYVTGGGTFAAGTTITISATPNSGYYFAQWNDGNTNATRTITVTGDATYIATFTATNGIGDINSDSWSIYPNPATTAVTVGGVEQATVTINDITGRIIATHNVADGDNSIDVSHLAAGTYFVRITSNGTSAVRKLIIK